MKSCLEACIKSLNHSNWNGHATAVEINLYLLIKKKL